jgi:drug/metabolite transporter (DMT)-like permease
MLGSIRFTTAGTLVFIIARLLGHSLAITRKELTNAIIAGFFFLAYGNGVFVWALRYVDTGFAALLASLQPLAVLIIMRIIQRKIIKPRTMVGVILGLSGMYILISQQQIMTKEGSALGILMIISCVLSWSGASVFTAQAHMHKNFFINTGYQMLSAGAIMALASFALGEEWKSPFYWSTDTLWSMAFLVLFGSIAAFTSFNYLLKIIATEKVATSAYVNPVIALFLGWYFLDEVITKQSIFAAVVLLTGVYFINTRKVR